MKVRVFGRELKVKIVDSLEDGDFGQYIESEQTIKIAKKCFKRKGFAKAVLVHEMVHAILGIGGLAQILSDTQEEAICVALEELAYHIDFIGEFENGDCRNA